MLDCYVVRGRKATQDSYHTAAQGHGKAKPLSYEPLSADQPLPAGGQPGFYANALGGGQKFSAPSLSSMWVC